MKNTPSSSSLPLLGLLGLWRLGRLGFLWGLGFLWRLGSLGRLGSLFLQFTVVLKVFFGHVRWLHLLFNHCTTTKLSFNKKSSHHHGDHHHQSCNKLHLFWFTLCFRLKKKNVKDLVSFVVCTNQFFVSDLHSKRVMLWSSFWIGNGSFDAVWRDMVWCQHYKSDPSTLQRDKTKIWRLEVHVPNYWTMHTRVTNWLNVKSRWMMENRWTVVYTHPRRACATIIMEFRTGLRVPPPTRFRHKI